jgi:hypothetical protein
VLWLLWGRARTRRASAASIVEQDVAGTAAGDVLLLNDTDFYSASGSWARTAAALPELLALLGSRGLKSRLLRRGGAATTVH